MKKKVKEKISIRANFIIPKITTDLLPVIDGYVFY